MKSRRRIASPQDSKRGIVAGQTGRLEVVTSAVGNVRFGSKADISACPRHVRFTPKSGHRAPVKSSGVLCPDVLNLPGAIQEFDTEMDRADAIRLLRALAAAGTDILAFNSFPLRVKSHCDVSVTNPRLDHPHGPHRSRRRRLRNLQRP